MNSLEREKTQLEHMREKEKQEQKDLTDWREKIVGEDPASGKRTPE